MITANMTGYIGSIPVPTVAKYDHKVDPYAVTLIVGPQEVEWTFARDLLLAGRETATGHGDVKVRPGEGGVLVYLSNGEHRAEILYRKKDLDAFVRAVYITVPLNEESKHIRWNTELVFGSE